MSRRPGGAADIGSDLGPSRPRERSNSVSSGGNSAGSGPSGAAASTSAQPTTSPQQTAMQFIPIRSRVGKRYQAAIPDMLVSSTETEKKPLEPLRRPQTLHLPRPRYCPDRAKELGVELDKYLKLARSLRDGATFDTQEQVTALALQHLHRFDYNPTDAACSLYARHSIELPRATAAAFQETSSKSTAAEEAKKWLAVFYRCMRRTLIDEQVLEQMRALHEKAHASADVVPTTEAGVLARLVARISAWREGCEAASKEKVERGRLLQLMYQAEDMQLVLAEKEAIECRLRTFDGALVQLREALERSTRRHQAKKVELEELNALFEAVTAPNLAFPEEEDYRATVEEATELKRTIMKMLVEEKVSLPVMRDVIAKIELVPVNFEREVDAFQKKMLSAQTWLAKARKYMPKRRATRRGGGTDPKKMDLDAIRALVDDAPCDDSTEMFEMQDLLECADEWAVKVKEAMEGGADVPIEFLKELLEEGKDIPVEMEEQKFLEAEVAAREWCTTATSILASRKSIEEIETVVTKAKRIRERIHPKKQSRWKPQVERDIHAAMDQARRWINDLRDHLGNAAFDKMFSSLLSYIPSSHSSRSESASMTNADRTKKKSMDAISKLIEKAQALAIDVCSYTTPLNELLLKGVEAQAEASAILMGIGCLSGTSAVDSTDLATSVSMETMAALQTPPQELGDLAQASALLERIDAFPFTFEEGLTLASIIEAEKNWAQRVRDCIPPRQSRKKRQANDPFTMEQLHELLAESKKLRFFFAEELRILMKELEDLTAWCAKAHHIVDGQVAASVAQVVKRLQAFDLLVYGKLQKAKKKLHIGEATNDVPGDEDSKVSSSVPSEAHNVIKKEEESNATAMNVDEETVDGSVVAPTTEKGENAGRDAVLVNGKDTIETQGTLETEVKPIYTNGYANADVLEIHVDSIMTHVRIESGCLQKSNIQEEDGDATAEDAKTSWMAKNGQSLLEPVLAMAEESLDAVNSLELKEEEARQTVEELVLAGEEGDITENITEESVQALEAWKAQLKQVQEESDLLSVVAPEQQALGLVVALLEWLQGSRSIFYDEVLPLRDLVVKGNQLSEELEAMKPLNVVKPETFELLQRMLWPLPYLESHEKVVLAWMERVHKCVADKHAGVDELQTLLNDGSGLLLEQDAFKIVLDEARKAKFWLSKLKKRIRALMSKRVGRMSLSAARSLVEEAEDLAIDMPVFDFLKEHLETASDWESRVLASGIETGQARIANLLALLNEYECARLVIDLDMHRDVLKSATERYCICRQPFDGLMIGCDHCDDWFHDNCIGMSKEKAEKVEHYTCPSCTILQELATVLQQAKAMGQQNSMWDMQEYAKVFEKQQAGALRKIKREEKTVERTEMLLFSCNNQMTQLRARIEDIERAKACLSINHIAPNGRPEQPQPSATTATAKATESATQTSKVGPASPTAPVGTNALLLAAAATATTSAGRSSSSSASAISDSGVAAASALAGMDAIALTRPQYPNILLPPLRPVNTMLTRLPPMEAMAVAAKAVTPGENGRVIGEANASVGGQPNTVVSATGSSVAPTATLTAPASAAGPSHLLPSAASNTVASSSAIQQSFTALQPPSLLNPMAVTLMGSTERLAALVVAGGVEQQLGKIKGEHAEAKKQVQELQDSLRLSRDRLANAQQTLRDLTEVFQARHRALPTAQTWVHQAVVLLNTTAVLSRSKIDSSSFLPPEYAAVLAELVPLVSTTTATSSTSTPTGTSIEELFPGVSLYARLLRTASWSLMVATMLQERPSRGELSDAIAYAKQNALWEDKKVLSPLRGVIGRVDAWVSRAHKCMTKTANKAQRLSRLKLLLNEYSKLPLTYVQASSPLENYVKLAAEDGGTHGKSSSQSEGGPLTVEAAGAAATTALEEAIAHFAASAAASHALATTASAAKQKAKQPPRKRKAYTRKDKAPARPSKLAKKTDPSTSASTVTSSPADSASAPSSASSVAEKEAATKASQPSSAASPNTAASA